MWEATPSKGGYHDSGISIDHESSFDNDIDRDDEDVAVI